MFHRKINESPNQTTELTATQEENYKGEIRK
jgi:hypothetical protein